MKPIKQGFKLWVRADSHNGYLFNFDIYTGKEESAETNLGAKAIKELLRTLVDKRYHLYFYLLDDELYACGNFCKDQRSLH